MQAHAVAPIMSRRDALFELACRNARTNLRAYLRWIWPVLNPGVKLDWNWHIDQICDVYQAWIEHKVMRVCINLPPGVSKTSANIAASTWELLNYPERRLYAISHDMRLAWDINEKRRQVFRSWQFRALLPAFDGVPRSRFAVRKDNVGEISTTRGGWVKTASPGTPILGGHGDAHYWDDPNNAKDLTPTALAKVAKWRDDEAKSRYRDHNWAREQVTQQRLADGDLSDVMTAAGLFDAPHGVQIIIPQEYDPNRAHSVTITAPGEDEPCLVLEDPRTKKGELLFPARYSRAKVEELKASAVIWSYQHQQEPLTIGHQMFRPEWFSRWVTTPQADAVRWMGSVDASGGSKQDDRNYSASYLVAQVWCVTRRGTVRLVDQLRMRANESETFGAFDVMWRRWRGAPGMQWLIEEKALGKPLCDAFKDNARYNVKPVTPETRGGSKEQRAQAWVSKAQDGWVEIPDLGAYRPPCLPAEVDPLTVRELPYFAELDTAKTATLAGRTWDAIEALARVDIPRGDRPARIRNTALVEAYRVIEACAIAQWSAPKWAEGWLTEACTFPRAPHDDQVDTASQAIRELWNSIGVQYGAPRRSAGGSRPDPGSRRRVRGASIKRR